MKNTALVIMAAGIGSRFGGGIKQLEPVGPNGEIIMDYSIHDAMEAGFNKVIFIIRRDLEKDFKEIIGHRIEKLLPVEYAYQELEDLPAGYEVTPGRTKPWGTGQAVLSVKGMVDGPFLVINADDYYGQEGFRRIHDYMAEHMDSQSEIYDICMGGFVLSNTLSDNGTVTRGVCQVDENGYLTNVTETYNIQMKEDGLHATDESGAPVTISPSQPVSMNMWAFSPSIINELQNAVDRFFAEEVEKNPLKSECFLPIEVDKLLKAGKATVEVLHSADKWFGVTYKEDKPFVMESIQKLKDAGVYPDVLW